MSEIVHFVEKVADEIVSPFIDITTQIGTGGLVGFDSEDGFGAGATVDVLKDVTGATAAEEANKDARNRFNQQKADELAARQESKDKQARDQRNKSNIAGVARGSFGSGKSGKNGTGGATNKSSTLGSDESDFLGL